jgi:hypothetical protein
MEKGFDTEEELDDIKSNPVDLTKLPVGEEVAHVENILPEVEHMNEEVKTKENISRIEQPTPIAIPMSIKDEIEPTSRVRMISQEYENGLKSYKVEVDHKFVQECYINDQEWDEGFRKFVGTNYPYTMSPKTSKLIAHLGTELKKQMYDNGFEIDPWKIEPEEEPYVLGVLRRVTVTDTIEPIIGYTDEIAKHLKAIKESDPSHTICSRSFFCGASVADKCLITRLHEYGVSTNHIATDWAADSIAIAALNFAVWNENLPAQEKYDIHIVKGDIPKELYGKDRTIVLQVADARHASKVDCDIPEAKFDALLVDNGLQYVGQDFAEELIGNVTSNRGSKGLYIGTLGLDSGIKVEIPKTYHLSQIVKSMITDLRKDYEKKATAEAPYAYPHKYKFEFDKENNNNVLITAVVSDGAARMYEWLGKLLLNDRERFIEVMDAVKSATELSKANKIVETTPFDYHQAMMRGIRKQGLLVKELEVPLEYEKFGWTKVGEDQYSNEKEIVDGGTMMRLCKLQDPLVLRRSRLYVSA